MEIGVKKAALSTMKWKKVNYVTTSLWRINTRAPKEQELGPSLFRMPSQVFWNVRKNTELADDIDIFLIFYLRECKTTGHKTEKY